MGMTFFRRSAAVLAVTLMPLAAVLAPLTASALPLAGQTAPDFTLPAPRGKAITLATLRGHAVYVNFFASWCGPCNDEAPSIGALRKKYAKQGVTVLGVDELEPAKAGAEFQSKYHTPFGLVAIDESGAVGRTYGTIYMPLHVFINRNGVVTTYHQGEMSPAEIDAAIRGSLK
jgi:peroxiredoxin